MTRGRLLTYVRAIGRWSVSDPLVQATVWVVAPLLALSLIGFALPCSLADRLRYAGLILQLAVMFTVGQSLYDKGTCSC